MAVYQRFCFGQGVGGLSITNQLVNFNQPRLTFAFSLGGGRQPGLGQGRGDREPWRFTGDALRALISYAWPGNVRELQNAVEGALALGQPPELGLEDLPPRLSGLTCHSDGEPLGVPPTAASGWPTLE